ncbi:PQQ-dependent sugar dehydrogenase [Paenibacillus tuaregi]|uniref:PQQ-dependent sugar dehydrogenase n=1 Tax=Paenibacillus tuaregi TaxID=1816681 RepID=UPI000837F6BD|nr:PQQ-dependent sugar dehydrogenase [Paenibacillus tuaregi]
MITRRKIMALSLCICMLLTLFPALGFAETEVQTETEIQTEAEEAVVTAAIPSPWKQQNIGSPTVTGSASYDPAADQFTVSGAGKDIWGKSDQFNYVYQPWTGDGSIVALVSSQTNSHDFAKAGIMIRETLKADSKHVDLLLTPSNGFTFQYRTETGGTMQSEKIASTSPAWIKLERKGNVIKGYVSNNGLNWGDLGNLTLNMNSSLYVGLAVSSHNESKLSTATFDKVKVNASGDVFPPTEPTNLQATSVTDTSVSISWTASLDDVGVKDYDVYKDNELVKANVKATTYTFTGLKPDTTYNFTVKARDTAGNISNSSSPLTVKTTNQTDTQAPTAPTGLTSPSKTSSSINLSWTASTDNVGVYEYDIYRNDTLAGTTPATSFNVTGLKANTTYSFTVKARDLAGNVSGASKALSVKTNPTSSDPYTPEVVANNLETPWAIDFAPDGRIFFTERNSGRVRVVENGKLKSTPVITLGDPFYYMPKSEGGLLGLAIDPNFATNHYIYIYHSYKTSDNKVANRVVRLIENNNKATIDKVLLTNLPGAVYHNGGRLKIGPDKKLYFADGNYGNKDDTLSYLGGKIFRLNLDGTIPSDNPFGSSSPIYSRGHRNPQGLAWQPGTNRLFESEHGEASKDEINFIEPGNNYGWPKYEGGNQNQPGITPPLIYASGTTWAPSGITFVTKGPWAGDLLVTNLKGKQIIRMAIGEKNGKPTISSNDLSYLFVNKYGRIRDIVEAPDGSLYFVTSNNGDKNGDGTPDKLVRLVPNFSNELESITE